MTIARLALEDGSIFRGLAFGAVDDPAARTGEVVFNTAMTGYQEALTDPSYAGQILCMTAPEIGNYGICPEDSEAGEPTVAGFIIRELARTRSNYRAFRDLSPWLAEAGVLGLHGIDTRALVRRLRSGGAMRGVLVAGEVPSNAELVEIARTSASMIGRNLAAAVSPRQGGVWDEPAGAWWPHDARRPGGDRYRVALLDCGAKRNICRHLHQRGCVVEQMPHDSSPDEIRRREPDGLLISNGPGDPAAVAEVVETLRAIAGEVPTFGICLGHQLLALALGATTFKLKFGHRGANQPVRNLITGRVEITSQNHGFCVDAESLESIDCEITHLHLNDGTVAGFRHRRRPIFSVQYHPEASPGPHDAGYLFDCFVEMMRSGDMLDADLMRRVAQSAERGGSQRQRLAKDLCPK